MIQLKKVNDLRDLLNSLKKAGKTIGFTPTMGALHPGHISLIEAAGKETDVNVCSLFVNPTQFNDPRDFEKYPHTLDKDIYRLESSGCDIVFIPSVRELYPDGTGQTVRYELGFLETVLEGKFRPGHFQGVCQVVHRLLEIIMPHHLYLGQKDYQQCMVIRKLIDLSRWDDQIKLKICPTIREADGLAMSSRNMLLNAESRKKAVMLSRVLKELKNNLSPGPLNTKTDNARNTLMQHDFRVDYIEFADAATLEPVSYWNGKQSLVVLGAAYIQDVRLIDNILLNNHTV